MPILYVLEDKCKVLSLFNKGLTKRNISKITGIPMTTVCRWISNPQGFTEKNVWSAHEEELLHNHYPKASKQDLLEMLSGRQWCSIESKANKLKIKRDLYRRSSLDFSVIDTEIKAYLLGFIAADGCIYRKGNNLVLEIQLGRKDLDLLEKIRDLICSETPLYFKKKKSDKHQGNVQFILSDNVCCQQLGKHGIVPRKSLILKSPQIEDHLINHFIRGLLDGDGSILLAKNRTSPSYLRCSISGTFEMMSYVNESFLSIYPHTNRVYQGHGNYQVAYGGSTGIAFATWIYTGATIYMDRKYAVAKPFLEVDLTRELSNSEGVL